MAGRHPAALVAPVLFLPRLKEISTLSGLGPARHWTALQVAGGLLAAGIFLRWLFAASPLKDFFPARGLENGAVSSDLGIGNSRSGTVAFLLFAAMVALSYLYSASPGYGGEKLLGFLTLGGGLFFASFLLCTSESDLRDLVIGTAIFGMAVAASSLSFSATGAMGTEDNPSHIGKGQVIGLAILLLLYSHIANRWVRASVVWVCIPFLALGLVSAQTRGPLFLAPSCAGVELFCRLDAVADGFEAANGLCSGGAGGRSDAPVDVLVLRR